MDPVLITKMSVSKLNCIPSACKTIDKPVRLCVIFGQATGIKQGEDTSRGQIWSALVGSFEGVNLQTGEVFRSGKLFLPGGIHETVEAAVRAISGQDGMSVKFGLELRSVKDTNPIGYSYQAINLIPAEAGDELSPLRLAIMDTGKVAGINGLYETAAKQLEAPKGDGLAPATSAKKGK